MEDIHFKQNYNVKLFKIITLPDKFPSKIFKQNKLRIGFLILNYLQIDRLKLLKKPKYFKAFGQKFNR